MAPAAGAAGLRAKWDALVSDKRVYFIYVLAIFSLGILAMVLPAELLNWVPPKEAKIVLDTTFGTLGDSGIFCLIVIGIMFIILVFDLVGADLLMNAVLATLVLFKVVTIKNAIAGFASPGLLTIVVLFIVAQGITSTGGAEYVIGKLLGTPKDTMLAQVRMCLIALVISSFVNDTPVFCMMLPIVLTWSARARIPLRQLVIPLSYCVLLGGLNTTIGTSTNLVVTGQFDTRVLDPKSPYYQEGVSSIPLFGPLPYGVPNGIWGVVYIVLAAPFFLPGGAGWRVFGRQRAALSRKASDAKGLGALAAAGDAAENVDYFVGLLVAAGSPAAGLTVAKAGLRQLEGQFLVAVRHRGQVLHAVGPDYVVSEGDVLYFAGVPDGVEALARAHGLRPFSDALEDVPEAELPGVGAAFGVASLALPKAGGGGAPGAPGADLELVSARVRKGSDVAGQTIRAASFRSRFHAAVVSVRRLGEPLPWSTRLGDTVLQADDELLLDVAPQFWTSTEVNEAFVEVSKAGAVRSHNEFMVPFRVTGVPLAGRAVNSAGLRQLPGAFLVAIDRGGRTLHAVSPDEVLQTGDVLWFAGTAASVRFVRNTPGLEPLAEKHASRIRNTPRVERRLAQAIIAAGSPLVDTTLREVQFREQFNAAVVAVARQGERLRAKPGDVRLRAGDVLLVDCGPAFSALHGGENAKYFSIVVEMDNTNPPRFLHTLIGVFSVATAFILYALEILDILPAAAVIVAVMLLTGCLSPDQARRAIRWDVYLMIAGSFGVSAALEQSGAAAAIANGVVSIGKNAGGDTFVIAAIYVATTLMSQVISNNSAAALVFPIAATISKNDGIDIYILSYAVMLGASSVFMSSFGYQTNLMALAAGGHSNRDFLKYGTPMQVVLAVISIWALAIGQDGFPTSVWIVTAIVGAVILSYPQLVELVQIARRKRAQSEAVEYPAK